MARTPLRNRGIPIILALMLYCTLFHLLIPRPKALETLGEPLSAAVCFYGINRSLRHTAFSIQKNLLGPFQRAGYKLDLFYHTYDHTTLLNPRSYEFNVPIDPNGFGLLGMFKAFQMTSQEEYIKQFNLNSWIINNTDAWGDGFRSLANLASQLHSIDQCCDLVASAAKPYKFVMFARPDLLYLDPLKPAQVRGFLKEPRVWILPNSDNTDEWWNDRFVIASQEDVQPWCHRIAVTNRFVEDKGITVHSERLVKAAAQYAGITKRTVELRLVRVRVGGKINAMFDAHWLKIWNLTHLINHTCHGQCVVS